MTGDSNFIDEQSKFLLYAVGKEVYGTSILTIREVLEDCDVKPVPRARPHFLGVINIRGEIVSVVDLRIRLGASPARGSAASMILFDSSAGAVAVKVDAINAVVSIPEKTIERKPSVENCLPLASLQGIAQIDSKLVTLIDLGAAFMEDDFLLPNTSCEAR